MRYDVAGRPRTACFPAGFERRRQKTGTRTVRPFVRTYKKQAGPERYGKTGADLCRRRFGKSGRNEKYILSLRS